MSKNSQILKIFTIFMAVFCLCSCKGEHPNPEQLDPIYKDLLSEHAALVKSLEGEEKRLEGLNADLKATEVRTMSRTTAKMDIKKSKKIIFDLKQKIKYTKIRRDRRLVEGRRSYKIAYKNGEDWPDPKEYESYKVYRKLKDSSLNWNERVPRLGSKKKKSK